MPVDYYILLRCSQVNWNLIKDMTPPSSEQEWIDEFEKYKQYPEYKQ